MRTTWLFSTWLLVANASAQDVCVSETKIYTAKIDLFASELGYYTFEECGDLVNPTIGMEVGETYTFIQSDRSNYFHPLGFAYFPDGAHADKPELEPGVTAGSSECIANLTCPAPMYFQGETYLGIYSNIPEVAAQTTGQDDFGLDAYEPLFFRTPPEWSSYDTFNIKLRFDDEAYSKDLFYFCHIHEFMSGRIKLLKNGAPVTESDDPPLGYEYDEPGTFDQECGTFGLDAFQLPTPFCPDTFVCGTDQVDEELQMFSTCINAMNCHMLSGMTTGVMASADTALFVHQMIPHHQNAVNMAKTLLKSGTLDCPDLTDEDSQDCILETVLREIVNTQNHQIQTMLAYLEANNYPETDNCVVPITTGTDAMNEGKDMNTTSTAWRAQTTKMAAGVAALMMTLFLC